MLIIDGHQDLAYNMLTFGRDYTLEAAETRRREQDSPIPSYNGNTLLGWPDYQRGKVAVIFATLFASPIKHKAGPWDTQSYTTPQEAHFLYRNQLDAYFRLCDDHPDKFRLIFTSHDLEQVLKPWLVEPLTQMGHAEVEENAQREALPPSREEQTPSGNPVGLVLLMEGAEGVRQPSELEEWWQLGLRIIGPAWAGTRFCGGTREPGPLTRDGYELLETMGDLGFGLDLSHMDEKAALQALDAYSGRVLASHSNVRALLKGTTSNRNLSDPVLRSLLEREGVIGIVPVNSFLHPGWSKEKHSSLTLDYVVAQIDAVCQMAGDARHAGLGSDFDGGFGLEAVPVEIDTIADLQKLAPLLAQKGYSEVDIAAIMGGNWLDLLRLLLPESI